MELISAVARKVSKARRAASRLLLPPRRALSAPPHQLGAAGACDEQRSVLPAQSNEAEAQAPAQTVQLKGARSLSRCSFACASQELPEPSAARHALLRAMSSSRAAVSLHFCF